MKRNDEEIITHKGNRNFFGNTRLETPDPITRIFIRTRITETCWIYEGKQFSRGYGRLRHKNKYHQVHRFIYESFFGPIEKGLVCRHTCDMRACINPKHILIGTTSENMKDMVERGRSLKGEKNHKAILTEEKVLEIRSKYKYRVYSYDRLALEHGVCKSAIANIVNRKTWKHIGDKK